MNQNMNDTGAAPQQGAQQSSAGDLKPLADPLEQKWSWGGLMLNVYIALATRQYLYLLLWLLFLVPIVNIIAMIGVPVFFGLRGTQMVKESPTFKNDDERRGFLRGIDHAGFIAFWIALAAMVLVGVVMAGAFMTGFDGARDKAERMSEERAMDAQEGTGAPATDGLSSPPPPPPALPDEENAAAVFEGWSANFPTEQ